ncbi:SPOSA6832_04578, partial [Sporobolomyces salmonicolor]
MGLSAGSRAQALRLARQFVAPIRPALGRPSFARFLSSAAHLPAKDYYVTTPIFYVNAGLSLFLQLSPRAPRLFDLTGTDPHIGHLHSTLLADIYARYARLRTPTDSPRTAILCTGTDEHGLKIQRVAEAKGVSPKELCDGVSERFRVTLPSCSFVRWDALIQDDEQDLARAANVDYQVFIRTTEERHRVAVEHVWRELDKRGYIYKSSYAGWYAVSDEAYYTESQVAEVIDPKSGEKYMASVETGTKVEWMEEENYKFRLSAFREPLLEWLSASSNPVQPPSRTAALLSSLTHSASTDLNDLSISRPSSRLSWGIQVPDDPRHTIYVWIDALVNYLTAAGYPWKGGEAFEEGKAWPPDLQVVGKDIIRPPRKKPLLTRNTKCSFHALYLPAVLLALDLPLPKNILAHGHWTMDRFKMSKSRGNVANPFEAMKLWGIDAMRMYLMRVGGNSAGDADYSAAEIERFYRKDLAGQMGNLLNRVTTTKLTKKLESPALMYTLPSSLEAEDEPLLKMLRDLPESFSAHLSSFEIHRALSCVFDVLAESNRHVQQLSPWLATATPSQVHRALFFGSESLRIVGILLQPFMPDKSSQLLEALGVDPLRRRWEDLAVGHGGERVATPVKGGLWPPVAAAPVMESS